MDKTETKSRAVGVEAGLDEGLVRDLVGGGEDNTDTSEEGSSLSGGEGDGGSEGAGLGELVEVTEGEGGVLLGLLSREEDSAVLAAVDTSLTLEDGDGSIHGVEDLGTEGVLALDVVGGGLDGGSLLTLEGVVKLQVGGQVGGNVVSTSVEGRVVGTSLELEARETSEGEGGVDLGGVVGSELTLPLTLDITSGEAVRGLEGTGDGTISIPLGNEDNLGTTGGLGGDLGLEVVLSRGEDVLQVVRARLANIIKKGGHNERYVCGKKEEKMGDECFKRESNTTKKFGSFVTFSGHTKKISDLFFVGDEPKWVRI